MYEQGIDLVARSQYLGGICYKGRNFSIQTVDDVIYQYR